MAVKIKVGIPEADGRIGVMHVFYGKNEKAARALMAAHADICPRFGPAVATHEVVESIFDLDDDEWPTADDLDADEIDSDDDGDGDEEIIEEDEEEEE